MLSNAYFLAKFRFNTAENEPAKNSQKIRPGPAAPAAAAPGARRRWPPRQRAARGCGGWQFDGSKIAFFQMFGAVQEAHRFKLHTVDPACRSHS